MLLDELADAGSADAALGREIGALRSLLGTPPEQLEGMGRLLAQRLVLATQAALLRKTAPSRVADAFIATRLGEAAWGRVVGAFDGRRRRHRSAAGARAAGLTVLMATMTGGRVGIEPTNDQRIMSPVYRHHIRYFHSP